VRDQGGNYVEGILDEANPADLPVKQSTQIEPWISLKTAEAIGIADPPQLQQVANRIRD